MGAYAPNPLHIHPPSAPGFTYYYFMNLIYIYYQCKKFHTDIQLYITISIKVFDSVIHYLKNITNSSIWLDSSENTFILLVHNN